MTGTPAPASSSRCPLRVRSDPVLAGSFSTVDEVETFQGDLALLVALAQLPSVSHFSGADLNHGLGAS